MSVGTFDPNQLISLSDAAIAHFQAALSNKPDGLVRIRTEESGCSGYAYRLDIVDASESDDVLVAVQDGLNVAVAQEAIELIRGTQIDMVTEGVNRVLKFNNPNVVAECGCGESFTVN